MMVQLLGLHTSITGGPGSMPSQELILQTQGKKKNRRVSHVLILPTSTSLFEPFPFPLILKENITLG